MFCNKCGQNLKDNATSCFNCGNVFSTVYPESTEPRLKTTFRGNKSYTTPDENYSFETEFKCSFDDGKKKKPAIEPTKETSVSHYPPTYTSVIPDPPSGSRAAAIIGMIIGIDALVSVSSLFYLLTYFSAEGYIIALMFLMAVCIVGASLSFKETPLLEMAIAGRITNLIALGVYSIFFIIALTYL